MEEERTNKIINKSLQAKLILKLPKEYIEMLDNLEIKNKLNQFLIVSQSEIIESNSLNIHVTTASGTECPRCWNVTENTNLNNLCIRCSKYFK